MFSIGGGTSSKRRCARALISNYVTIPVLQGLRKDHKPNREGSEILGPKLRPLCAANRAPNAALGGIIAKTVKALSDNITDKANSEVISTEELKRKIEDVNKIIINDTNTREKLPRKNKRIPLQNNELVAFSMDVSALYPSIT